jgi:hypothetical protein
LLRVILGSDAAPDGHGKGETAMPRPIGSLAVVRVSGAGSRHAHMVGPPVDSRHADSHPDKRTDIRRTHNRN